MRFIIDRIEEGIAVCEELSHGNGILREFILSELPDGVKEGDVFEYKDNKPTPNPAAVCERQVLVKKLMDDVFE